MIEVAVPNDICKYESKLIGPFTLRETVSLGIAAIVSFGLYKLFGDAFTIETIGYVIIPIIAPILVCGWYKPYGIPFEKFIWIVFNTMFLAPRVRKYQIRNQWEELLQEECSSNEKKGGKAETKKKMKKNKKKTEIEEEDKISA